MGLAADTYTFLFTDIVGSTRLMQSAEDAMVAALDAHDSLLLSLFQGRGGHVFKHTGDGYCAAFASPREALHAALDAQHSLRRYAWGLPEALRIRMAIHTGTALAQEDDYRGIALSRTNRLMSVAHGGQILLSEAAEAVLRDTLPEDACLMGLGSVRLPGLERAERIFQVHAPGLEQEFPPPRSMETFPHNLKEQLTSFVGRERELGEVLALCRAHRLVTVTGPGGCGKTRLALQAASHLVNEYADGIWLVELAGLTDPALIPAAVAAELKVRQDGMQSLDAELFAFLKPRRLLFVLDNCEHLIEASAQFAHALLRNAPGAHCLVTSRERLNVGGERVWRIPPLTAPAGAGAVTVESVLASDAATLFVERAVAVQPRFVLSAGNAQPVAQVCRRLEGLPLAVELAAAWAGTIPVDQIALRLGEHFRLLSYGPRPIAARHQTLQAALDWSYALLTDHERLLLCRLSVFSGGWTLDAAEAVCAGAGIGEFEVLDLLHCLVDKSLVVPEDEDGAMRYRLLETLRVYSLDKLRAMDGERDWRERHAAYFLEWAESAEPMLTGSEQGPWLTRIERDHDNLRTALAYLRETDAESFQRLVSALWQFWYTRGYLTEGRTWLEEAVTKAKETVSVIRAKAMNRAGVFAWAQGDLEIAWTRLQASLAISRTLGDDFRIASALTNLALVAGDRSDFDAAAQCHAESITIYHNINDSQRIAIALHNLGLLAARRGDDLSATTHYKESLALSKSLDDGSTTALTLHALGEAAYRLGDLNLAAFYLRQGLEHSCSSHVGIDIPVSSWCYLGYLAVAKQFDAYAVRLISYYVQMKTRQRTSETEAETNLRHQHLETLRMRVSDEEFDRLWNDANPATIKELLSLEQLWH